MAHQRIVSLRALRAFTLAIGVAGFACISFGQGGQAPAPTGPATGTPGTAPGGGVGTPGGQSPSPFPGQNNRNQSPFPDPNQRQTFPDQQRPIFISGKVQLDDGTPPPDSVVIERLCNGIARPEAYTDSKGRFSFQLGQNRGMMADASVSSAADSGFGGGQGGIGGMGGSSRGGMNPSGGISERDLMGCELRAVLAGFRSEPVNLGGRRAFDNPDVGTLILRRLANVEGTTISATSLNAPKDAKKAFEKGRDLLKKKKSPEAQKEFEKAVAAYPKYATAWFELGLLQQQQNMTDEARTSYAQALAADAKFISPYLQLATLAAKENKWQDVADTTDRALRLNPIDFPQAFFYNSVANYNLKKFEAAEKSAREAVKLDTMHRMPKAAHLLGVILAEKQDFSGAAEQMKNYLKFSPGGQDVELVKKQLLELEKFATAKNEPAQKQ